jgi:hypothetical protein
MPDEVMVGKRYAFVDWWPMELIHHALSELSPQDRAQLEMNNHILECLELIRLATISDQAFSELWIGSNEPFFAAGRLVYGDFQWVREVPLDMIRNGGEMQALLERIRKCSREYVGLIRLALLTDAESPLLERISLTVQQFNLRYLSEIPSWQRLARDLLDGVVVSPLDPKIANPKVYAEVDAASDELRQDLAEVTVGLEGEIVMLINQSGFF